MSCDTSFLEGRPSIAVRSPVGSTIRRSPLKIAVDIEAPSPIAHVEFFVGTEKVGERSEGPWEALYRFASTTHGDVVLRVRATTEEGKTNEVRRVVRVNPDTTLPRVELFTPRNRETLPPSAFPYTTSVKATDPSGIAAVDVLYAVAGQRTQLRIGRVTEPVPGQSTRFRVVWEITPAPGTYEIRARATDKTGNVAQTSPVTIVIP